MSEREFLALPTSTVATSTPWTPKSDFTGPLLSKVLGEVGATGKTLRLIALDDFSVEVDADYLEKYGTILATSKDGVRLTIRDFDRSSSCILATVSGRNWTRQLRRHTWSGSYAG